MLEEGLEVGGPWALGRGGEYCGRWGVDSRRGLRYLGRDRRVYSLRHRLFYEVMAALCRPTF